MEFPIETAYKYPLHVYDGAVEIDAGTVTFASAPEGIIAVQVDELLRKVFPIAPGSATLTFSKGTKSGSADFIVTASPEGELTLTLDTGQPL